MAAIVSIEEYFRMAPHYRRVRYAEGSFRYQEHLPEPDPAYVLDEARGIYQKKPFQIKFADEEANILVAKNLVEPIKQYQEAVLEDGQLIIRDPSRKTIGYERSICGEPIIFYLAAAHEVAGKNGDALISMIRFGYMVTEFAPNPYNYMDASYTAARRLMSKYETLLTAEQREEFEIQHDDIVCRMRYTETHPLPPLVPR